MSSTALVVIARDEARCIERCLASLRPWVDRMLVLDTGSIDDTAARAQASGAQVHRFDWVDDFSAARNHLLALSDADWNVVVDADEWLADGGPALVALRQTPPGFVGQIRVDSEFDGDDGVSVAPSWLARVLPRGVRFVGRVHEQPEAGPVRRRLDIRLAHDGYRESLQRAKRGRNERLLHLDLAAKPDDAYLRYQLGKELEKDDRFEAAVAHYEAAYANCRADATWRHDLMLRLVFSLKCCCQWARAIAVAEAEMARWPQSPDYFFALGDLLLDWAVAEPARADELLPMIESSWMKCLALGDNLELEGAVRGRGSFLAAKNLAAFHAMKGGSQRAADFRRLEAELRVAATR
jgi:glycosyltransferase involved in cell wall biosynthesis